MGQKRLDDVSKARGFLSEGFLKKLNGGKVNSSGLPPTIKNRVAKNAWEAERLTELADANSKRILAAHKAQIRVNAIAASKQRSEASLHRLMEKNSALPKLGRKRRYLSTMTSREQQYSHILAVLEHYMKVYKVKYCYPSQQTICTCLLRWYDIVIPRSTLNLRLNEMRDLGLIKSYRSHKVCKFTGKMLFKSSKYYIKAAGKKMRKLWKQIYFTTKYSLKAVGFIVDDILASEATYKKARKINKKAVSKILDNNIIRSSYKGLEKEKDHHEGGKKTNKTSNWMPEQKPIPE